MFCSRREHAKDLSRPSWEKTKKKHEDGWNGGNKGDRWNWNTSRREGPTWIKLDFLRQTRSPPVVSQPRTNHRTRPQPFDLTATLTLCCFNLLIVFNSNCFFVSICSVGSWRQWRGFQRDACSSHRDQNYHLRVCWGDCEQTVCHSPCWWV